MPTFRRLLGPLKHCYPTGWKPRRLRFES